MAEHQNITESQDHAEHDHMSKAKIWKVAGILSLLTAIEFFIALWVIPNHYMSHKVGNIIYILLTLWKAFYIIAYFMHLKFERKGLILSVSICFIFIVYFIVLMFIEGDFLSWHMTNF